MIYAVFVDTLLRKLDRNQVVKGFCNKTFVNNNLQSKERGKGQCERSVFPNVFSKDLPAGQVFHSIVKIDHHFSPRQVILH